MAGKSGGNSKGGKTAMTPARASAIQSATAKTGPVQKGSFAARAQTAAATNVNTGVVPASAAKK